MQRSLRSVSILIYGLLLVGAGAAAAADDFPKLKAGLWEVTTTTTRREGQGAPKGITMCLDATVQQEMYKMSTGVMSGMCSKHDLKYSGNTLTSVSTCEMNGTKMESKAVMTVTGDTAYHTEAHTTFDPPMKSGAKEATNVIDGKHVGPCKPGQQPGDMIMPGGQTVNIRQMMMGQQKG